MNSSTDTLALQLTNEFLDAYDSTDDQKLKALKRKFGIEGQSVMAGLLDWYAEHRN